MKKFYTLLFSMFFCGLGYAQIRVELTNVDQWVKNNFIGQGVVVGHIKTHFPAKEAAGIFNSNGILQINDGLVLSTGDVRRIGGLNDQFNLSTGFNLTGTPEKDEDLQKIEKGNLFDVNYIEFDFVPYNNSISFNYQFGSDEYPEYVGSAFNDVFAFIVSDGKESKNIALIPEKNTPVSINTVNFKTDSIYYIDNNPFRLKTMNREDPNMEEQEIYRTRVGEILYAIKKFFTPKDEIFNPISQVIEPDENLIKKLNQKLYNNLQFDGITTKLVAQTYVEPYKRYHLKIIISDVSDNIYDSGVFLEKGSLTTVKDEKQPGFINYPDFSQQIDIQKIMEGAKLEDLVSIPNQNLEKNLSLDKLESNHISTDTQESTHIIYFDFDVATPNQTETQKIYELAKAYKNLGKGYGVAVIGHTDNKGSLNYNLDLSLKRSETVANCLKSIIPDLKNINIISKAYLLPASSNETDEGRSLNRRVEVKFTKIK
ncbi:MAG: OmpA family protein [Bacteroidetes bacterium]|nr:OmpA family protein [Bacteroidota bacterium]MBU1373496.1 OmpA family protein [Bacteroidota bacterium]MBU1485254.1 OmpA family protein [Bacteroidota bacterium]MBU1760939.1 OmpA family protein [Bacteroidota bacterium]MBU2046283.1 OmpA family protein [Bacteroidota bacterium]